MNLSKFVLTLFLSVSLGAAPLAASASTAGIGDASRSFLFFGKKKKKTASTSADSTSSRSDYEKLTDAATVSKGMFNVLKKENEYYFEIPDSLLGRDMLVINKLVRVPSELNDAGVNRGINTSNQMVRFELDKENKKVYVRQSRVLPDVDESTPLARSVHDNYIDPIIASFKVEAHNSDSTTTVVKVTDLFNGRNSSFSDIFNEISLGTSVSNDLSKIKSVKAFDNNVYAIGELTTKVVEPGGAVNVTVEVGTTILLLPEKRMARRYISPRVGYFHESTLGYDENQQRVHRGHYITRWRLEPKPEERIAYLEGKLVEPQKPIVFYLDNSTPVKWRDYIRKGIEDWNSAFEGAGFKNAVKVIQLPDSTDTDYDDINYSTLTYAASTKSNAMGPSITDPRSGEILEADIIWWHNVIDVLHDWIIVQTGAVNPAARSLELPDSLMGDAMRFVACHEVGHSLGLRHNMIASAAIPTDSLRSPSYMRKIGSPSASIMDYARFNYVAQPGDGVDVLSPQIGPYDRMAIEYGYRWYGEDDPKKDYTLCMRLLDKYKGNLYRYSETQDYRDAFDPRALTEDLGDDPVKSAKYGMENLRRIVPHIVEWTKSGEPGQDYDEASSLYYSIIGQWQRYLYHVIANIGGIYVDNTTVGDGNETYIPVPAERQRDAMQFLIDELLTYPRWLFGADVTRYTFLISNTPIGRRETAPSFALKTAQCYLLWDLLADNRIIRMYEADTFFPESFKASEMMDMLHNHIFRPTRPDMHERSVQKNFVDALIIAANENQGVKDGSKRSFLDEDGEFGAMFHATAERGLLQCPDCHAVGERTAGSRILHFYGSQANRISDAISLKRGELLRIRRLLQSRMASANGDILYHYEDLLMRINTALGIAQPKH